ncbi:uncharacterized protein LOC124434576 [Xenia sp. Carnegie-2017]|uniref:uncharacterized protein LOC124434576 n=1 Tax=Xenia sp. Carnegie-2017 TaxID=2897299 RepID=UPI001F03D167|nr:uncharacterized protein LOC124434576 [Xenia sp. Carnegie-2017]
MLDAGELAWLSLNVHHMKFLKMEGFVCKDSFLRHKVYNFTVCKCKLGEETGSTVSFYLSWTSCKLLMAQYYVYFIIVFFTSMLLWSLFVHACLFCSYSKADFTDNKCRERG